MTFEELIGLDSSKLSQMSDDELLATLAPCLVNCPPVEITIIHAAEEAEKQVRLVKKEAAKAQKLANLPPAEQIKKISSKPPTDPQELLDFINKQMCLLKK